MAGTNCHSPDASALEYASGTKALSTTGNTVVVVQYKFNYVKEALRVHEHPQIVSNL